MRNSNSTLIPELPNTIQWLYLNNNKFTGIIEVRNLSKSIEVFQINDNKFTGVFDAKWLRENRGIKYGISYRGNLFEKIIK